jgi:predicted ATPase/DNA-binding CsgD family transcriptional regulator
MHPSPVVTYRCFTASRRERFDSRTPYRSTSPDAADEDRTIAKRRNDDRRGLRATARKVLDVLPDRWDGATGSYPFRTMQGDARGSRLARIAGPPTFTTFVGRRPLLTEVKQRLAESRAVTLTGPGGIGKTRVAAQVAADEQGGFRDGVWWADVSTVPDAELVAATVAAALDLRAETAVPLTELIVDHVAERRALLVLDGCERELPAVVQLALVLRTECPRLRILVTSRQVLGISGEAVVRVPSMTVPEPDAAMTPESLPQYESVALFVERAALVGSDFRLTDDNAADVGHLCRELDGIPLALELAASRSAALSPAAMVEQLSDHLRLLDQGYADAPDRHRSLAACADWSFDLCTPAQQALWCRMSVFADGCDLAAVERVCAGDDIEVDAVPALVASLVDSSIVGATHADDGTVRYRMPAYLAAFGRQRLVDDATLARWRGQHALWITELAAGFRAQWVGSRQVELLRAARREHANVRAALEFCSTDVALGELVLDIASDLDAYWVTTGLANEARHWLETGLETKRGKPAQRALAMVLAARFAGLQNDLPTAHAWLEQATAEAESADDDRARGLALVLRALLAFWGGDADAAVTASRASIPLLRAGDDAELLALFVEGLCLGAAGELDAAAVALEQAIARSEELGETFRRSLALSGLAELALTGGDHAAATEHATEALRMKADLDDRMGIAIVLDCLARIALEESHAERAAVLLGAAHAIWDQIGMRDTGNPFTRTESPWEEVHTARRRLGTSAFRRAFRRGSTLPRAWAVRYALTGELEESPATGPAEESPLTKREAEVAGLVAQGLSNPEIAERLVISVRTAQGHVENILRKLGFTSRTMIAAWAAQREATPPAEPVPD